MEARDHMTSRALLVLAVVAAPAAAAAFPPYRSTDAETAEPWRLQILELLARCKGNLVRVHEEVVAAGADLSYPALTAFCRWHGFGHARPEATGH